MRAGDRVLEAGAGAWRFSVELARLGARITALDISPVQLDLHRRHLADDGLDASVEERAIGDIVDLSRFADGAVGAVVCGISGGMTDSRSTSGSVVTPPRRAEKGSPRAWVAFVDGEPAGSVSLVEHNPDTRPELSPWLAALWVRPEYRGRGVGTGLVRRCEEETRRLGVRRLHLYTEELSGFTRRWVGRW